MTTREQLAKELNSTSQVLCDKYEIMASTLISKDTARTNAVRQEIMTGASVAAAERMGDANALDLTNVITKTVGEIKALEERRDNIRFMIKYGLESFI